MPHRNPEAALTNYFRVPVVVSGISHRGRFSSARTVPGGFLVKMKQSVGYTFYEVIIYYLLIIHVAF
jgi:hypothetical protein